MTIDVDTLLNDAARANTTRDVEAALHGDGHLVLGGARLQAVAAALASWEAFTALPLEVRRRYHTSVRDGEAGGGWSLMREHPVYSSHMSAAELASSEPKQEYGFSVETGRTLWPDDTVAPGLAHDAGAVAALFDRIARALLGAFGEVLGQEPGFLRHRPGYMALKHYPGQPMANSEDADDGLQEHSDAVVFTMLAQSRESLQIRGRDGGWLSPRADPAGCLLVIPGDWMEIFSNGEIPAVRHRVRDTTKARTSLAYFQNVAPMTIAPLERFVGDGAAPGYPTVRSDIDYAGGKSGVPRWKTALSGAVAAG